MLLENENSRLDSGLLVSKSKAAALLDVSVRTVERLVASGELIRVRVRGCIRITLDSIREYLGRGGAK